MWMDIGEKLYGEGRDGEYFACDNCGKVIIYPWVKHMRYCFHCGKFHGGKYGKRGKEGS